MQKRPALEQLLSDWHDHGWPTATLPLFRMEGEGGDAGVGGGDQGDGGAGGGDQGGGQTVETLQAELDKWKNQSRKHEQRAKENAAAQAELEKVRQSQMSEQEKAVAQARTEAKAEGRAEAIAELGPRIIAAEIRGAAAGRFADDQLTTLMEGINAAAFLTDDGEVDTAKVTKFVNGLAPAQDDDAGTRRPNLDLGQGARGGGGGNQALNGDPLLRDLKAKVGVR